MANYRVNTRYASALFDVAKENNAENQVHDDMNEIIFVYLNVPEFKKFLNNPALSALKKNDVLNKMFPSFNEVTLKFFRLIAKKTRLGDVLGIAQAYIETYRDNKNIATVAAYSAMELTDAQKKHLLKNLEAQLEKAVVINYKVIPDMIGGLKLLYDNNEYDASLKKKFQTLRQHFSLNLHKAQI